MVTLYPLPICTSRLPHMLSFEHAKEQFNQTQPGSFGKITYVDKTIIEGGTGVIFMPPRTSPNWSVHTTMPFYVLFISVNHDLHVLRLKFKQPANYFNGMAYAPKPL